MKNSQATLGYLMCVILGVFTVTGCGGGGGSSTSMSSARASVEGTADKLFPVAGQHIDSALANKYIRQYSQTLNSKNELTKYVVFRTDSLIKALEGYYRNEGEYVRVYFGVDSVGFEFEGNRFNRLNVFFQPAMENSQKELVDLPYSPGTKDTKPFNLGLICPPPKCVGRSNYYQSL
ncbi:MAG TPA: hypothetical protein PK509_11400 [Catalimonadaceae bacterium]|nr:hypothetical protein [Catalimonadaceae bacterium]